MVKFENGYSVETVFDGSKLGIEPYSIEVLPNGELLILDSENSNIYKISSSLSLCKYKFCGLLILEEIVMMLRPRLCFCHHFKLNAHGDYSTKRCCIWKNWWNFLVLQIENSKVWALLLFYGDFAVSLSFLEWVCRGWYQYTGIV